VRAAIVAAGAAFFDAALAALAAGAEPRALVAALKRATGQGGAALFRPLRAALTQRHDGPELASLLAAMPPAIVRERLAAARALAAAPDSR
jgi:glutamyl-tRNA synthetase